MAKIPFRAILCALIATICLSATCAWALDWEVERNFRYFLYPSDVAVQRIAADIYRGHMGRAATPEELELFLNGPDFWRSALQNAGAQRDSWPAAWRQTRYYDVASLIQALRADEGRAGQFAVERDGWGSLLGHRSGAGNPFGNTDTCWNPNLRLHVNCKRYGDYVRPPGWIVRVYDEAAAPGDRCVWSGDGGFFAGSRRESDFAAPSGGAIAGAGPWTAPAQQDCREIRVYVPSDPSDAKAVKGKIHVAKAAQGGASVTIEIAPSDQLVLGFGDSFTSGEGNPELPAVFTGGVWPGIGLPKRDYDPSTRAQWTDRWCHRSVYSWQVRTAIDAALRSPHRSITALPYGCSGAEIFSGLLFSYDGVEYYPSEDRGVIGHRSAFGLAYQELCKTYASVTSPYRQPAAQDDLALTNAVAAGLSVDAWKAQFPAASKLLASLRKNVTRCNAAGAHFKRDADLVLLDIGINDVQFSSWVASLVLDPTLSASVGGFTPKIAKPGETCDAACARTELLLARMAYRFDVLREVMDKQLLPDLGLAAPGASRVIVPLYPKALEDETGALCGVGNGGMTATVFPGGFGLSDWLCQARIWPNAGGPITAIRNAGDVGDVEWFRDHELNRNLRNFAQKTSGAGPFVVVEKQVDQFAKRGFCATQDAASRPTAGQCFTYGDLLDLPCQSSTVESLHVPHNGNLSCGGAIGFSPFSIGEFLPYRPRTRLLRTQNDVYMLIDNRDKKYDDETTAGIRDINGRTTSGAFHPTAEAHAIVATATAEEACKALGCER